jgi:hypothetical protein
VARENIGIENGCGKKVCWGSKKKKREEGAKFGESV